METEGNYSRNTNENLPLLTSENDVKGHKNMRINTMGNENFTTAHNTNPNNNKTLLSTFKFNNINPNVNNIRAYGMSEFQSSTTLQRSVNSISIPKAARFNHKRIVSLGGQYNICSKDTKKLGPLIGYGDKSDFSKTSTKDYPSPLTYHIKPIIDSNMKSHFGPTIKGKYKGMKPDDTPGPGAYQTNKPVKMNHVDISLIMNLDIDMKNKEHCISPQKYLPSMVSQESGRYKSPGFGYSTKLAKPSTERTPGVGTYNLKSVFRAKKFNREPIN